MSTGLIHKHVSPRARKRAAKWRLAAIIKVSRGCADCGYDKHPEALQFDHISDDKKDNVSDLIRSDYAWSTILTEINKCEIRCANCHAVMTAHRKRAYRESAPSTAHSGISGHTNLDEAIHSQQSIPLSFDEPPTILGEVPALSFAWFQRLLQKHPQ